MVNPLARISYQGQPLSVNLRKPIALPSGGIYVLPYGDFYIQLGRQCVMQYYDSNDGHWHSHHFGGVGAPPFYVGSDGTNYRVINVSSTVVGVSMTNNGSAYTAAPTVAFAAPASGITATGAAIVGGDLTFSIVAGGTGYTNPTIVIDPPNSGNAVPAIATATISGGSITAVTLGAGCGYTAVPNVTVLDPAGVNATITAAIGTTNASKVLAVRITNPGSGYTGTNVPAITFTGGGGSSAAGTAVMAFALSSVTVTAAGANYTVAPMILTDGGFIEANDDGEESLPFRPAMGLATLSSNSITAVTIQDEGFGFQKAPNVVATSSSNTASSNAATLTAVVGGVTSFVSIWQLG